FANSSPVQTNVVHLRWHRRATPIENPHRKALNPSTFYLSSSHKALKGDYQTYSYQHGYGEAKGLSLTKAAARTLTRVVSTVPHRLSHTKNVMPLPRYKLQDNESTYS